MRRFLARLRSRGGSTPAIRAGRGVLAALAIALLTAGARASEPAPIPPPSPDPEAAALPETAGPRVCTPLGCIGAPSPSWSSAASFGAAVLASVWLGRRRRGDSDPTSE